jgi:hypothetical protein
MAQENTKIVEGKIDQLIPDDKNMNKHNQYGMSLLEKSIGNLGLGRSILVDKNNKIIAGNGVTETASSLGLDNVIIVPTDGKKLVVVRRDDIDLDSKEGRELALADNAVANVNLEWDEEALQEITEQWGIVSKDWGVTVDFDTPDSEEEEQEDGKKPEVEEIAIIVTCSNELDQALKMDELVKLGYQCRKTVVIGSKTKEVKSK